MTCEGLQCSSDAADKMWRAINYYFSRIGVRWRSVADNDLQFWQFYGNQSNEPRAADVISANVYAGLGGLYLLSSTWSKTTSSPEIDQISKRIETFLLEDLRNKRLKPFFFEGDLGTLWLLSINSVEFQANSLIDSMFGGDWIQQFECFDLIGGVCDAIYGLQNLCLIEPNSRYTSLLEDSCGFLEKFDARAIISHQIKRREGVLDIGLAHGLSGIALKYAELGVKYRRPKMVTTAIELLVFEDQFFDPHLSCWPYEIHTSGRTLNPIEIDPTDRPSSWCRGISGALLARATVTRITGANDFEKIIARLRSEYFAIAVPFVEYSHSLCHGILGNILIGYHLNLFDKAQHQKIDHFLSSYFSEYADNEVFCYSSYPRFKSLAPDHSLFCGHSGVAYFAMRMLPNFGIPDLLCVSTPPPIRPISSMGIDNIGTKEDL